MSIETEIKAHVEDSIVEEVKARLLSLKPCIEHGSISKFDLYWSTTEDGDPVFRTRREMDAGKPRVLFTAKPHKTKSQGGTESNEELEFSVSDRQWDDVLRFVDGIGYKVCRVKWKNGWHCTLVHDGFEIHAELLNVKYLGWFLEMEICSDDDGIDFAAADKALREVLSIAGVDEDAIEPTGYNKMLKAIGHDRG